MNHKIWPQTDVASPGRSLASVLEHCMYCGMSLARVGLDFRGLLPPIFEAAIANVFNKVDLLLRRPSP